MSIIVSDSPLNISKTVRDRALVPEDHPGNDINSWLVG